MVKWDGVLRRVMGGQADRNIRFDDLRGLLERLGFDERVRGDHHLFSKDGVREIIDLQPLPDGKAKAYPVKQVRDNPAEVRACSDTVDGSHTVYKYRMNVWWSREDNAWLVEIPELPGAMADGPTPEEAVANAKVVIENWIAVVRERGREVPEPEAITASKN